MARLPVDHRPSPTWKCSSTMINMNVPGGGTPGDQSILSSMVALTKSSVDVDTQQTTTSTSYVDLATVGPAITLTPGVTQTHYLIVGSELWHTTSNANTYHSVSVAGAAAADQDAAYTFGTIGLKSLRAVVASAVASGSTHTSKYRVVSGTGNYTLRRLLGWAA